MGHAGRLVRRWSQSAPTVRTHTAWTSANKASLGNQRFSIATWVYILTATIKLSVLFFYYHIFSLQRMSKYILILVMALVAGLHVGISLALVFGSWPIEKQ